MLGFVPQPNVRGMSSLESAMVSVKHEVAHGDETDARQQVTLDKLVERIQRIERRLELLG
jgi:hypothetical protein